MKIKGNKNDNKFVGTDENDKILGLGGDDTITAKGGHDTVYGGAGNDKITIAANTSASVDAGKGNDSVKLSAGALGSTIDLGKGDDSVEIKGSTQTGESFTIAGGDGDDTVNFAVDQADFKSAIQNDDGSYTVTDTNDNIYTISDIAKLTFNGVDFQEPGNPTNEAPIVSNLIADQSTMASTAYTFQVAANTFTDPDGDALTYTASLADGSALPSWLTFDAATRTFSGTPTASNVGSVSVRVTASDGALSNFDDFTVTVNNVVTPPPPPPVVVDPVVTGHVLLLTSAYDYDVSETGGVISVSYQGKTTTYNSADIDSVKTIGSSSVDVDTTGWDPRPIDGDVNFTNVIFQQAGPGIPVDQKFDSTFEIAPDIDISITGAVTVNGNAADYFRAAWDWLDDRYTQSLSNYYAEQLNSYGIDLGIQYALYLKNGGAPLFDIAKFTSDSGDAGSKPDRLQTLHDNLLGNLDERSIDDKFNDKSGSPDPSAEVYSVDAIRGRIEAALGPDYLGTWGNFNDGRGIFTGNEGDYNSAAHNTVRRFDYDHGIVRPDNIDYTTDGSVDKLAWNVNEMWYGTGNRTDNWVVERNVGANVETALKVHYRQGNEIDPTSVDVDGVVIFNVDAGSQTAGENGASQTAAGRSAWSFDYSIATGINGKPLNVNALDFELKVDTDKSGAVDYMIFKLEGGGGITPFVAEDEFGNFIGSSGEDPSTGDGTLPFIAQDSINFGFDFLKNAIESGGYAFGDGAFDIELLAYKNNTHDLLSSVHIRVVVDDGIVI